MNDEQLWQVALNEVKDQFKIYLETYDDIKKRVQILLIVCSLFITLPLASDYAISIVLKRIPTLILFLTGMLLLIFSITILIMAVHESPVRMPLFDDVIRSVGRYRPSAILQALTFSYNANLNRNIRTMERRRILIKYSESFIKLGVLLVTIGLIGAVLF